MAGKLTLDVISVSRIKYVLLKASRKRLATGNVFKTDENHEELEEGMARLRGVEKHPRKGKSCQGLRGKECDPLLWLVAYLWRMFEHRLTGS